MQRIYCILLPNIGYTCKLGTNWLGRTLLGKQNSINKKAATLTENGVKQDTQAGTAVSTSREEV